MRINTVKPNNINFGDYYQFRVFGSDRKLVRIVKNPDNTDVRDFHVQYIDEYGKISSAPSNWANSFFIDKNQCLVYRPYNPKTGTGGEFVAVDVPRLRHIARDDYYSTTVLNTEDKCISKGSTEGVIVVDKNGVVSDIPENVPVIYVKTSTAKINDYIEMILLKHPNIKGFVITNAPNIAVLSHDMNMLSSSLPFWSCIINDEQKVKDLIQLEGKIVRIENKKGKPVFKEINQEEKQLTTSKVAKRVQVPHLVHVDKLIPPEEITPQNSGNKGYRLRILQELSENGELKDITVPKFFIIPEGYINKMKEASQDKDKREHITQEICIMTEAMGMQKPGLLIARSNFNTEDRRNFSSAGIYSSNIISSFNNLFNTTMKVATKESKEAEFVYEQNGIKKREVQPGVIIQDYIDPDYTFTIYTSDDNDNLIINLNAFEYLRAGGSAATVLYNKKNKNLKVLKDFYPDITYTLDADGNIIKKEQNNMLIKKSERMYELLRKAAEGAEFLEKYFGYPQDIEGGICLNEDKPFFCQSRDIVNA